MDLGGSRTPSREASNRLEQEGLVRSVPRKGVFVVRKTKAEILEMIVVWAALAVMAARLITLHASDAEIATLRAMSATFESDQISARIDEYSERHLLFHQATIGLSRRYLLEQISAKQFIHIRALWVKTQYNSD